jgi:hypothetical protein
LNPLDYQNVGDFIIDVLGLPPDEDGHARSPIHATHFTNSSEIEEGVATDGSADDGEHLSHLKATAVVRIPHQMCILSCWGRDWLAVGAHRDARTLWIDSTRDRSSAERRPGASVREVRHVVRTAAGRSEKV